MYRIISISLSLFVFKLIGWKHILDYSNSKPSIPDVTILNWIIEADNMIEEYLYAIWYNLIFEWATFFNIL